MGKFDQDLDASFWDDVSVWDRVRSLAPSGDPVAGRLFARNSNAPVKPVHDILEYQAAEPGSAVVEHDDPTRFWAELDRVDDRATSQIIADDDDPVVQSVDLLRSRLIPVLEKNNWRRVAIVSPEIGNGSSFLACNLAARLSRVAAVRTVLMDLNLRDPRIAQAFGIGATNDPHDLLTGMTPLNEGLVRMGDNLVLGLADQPAHSPVETLSDPRTRVTLESMETALRPDITLFDLPPMLAYPDMSAFLPYVDAVLLVADATATKAAQISECERAIAGQANLLGVVLNKTRTKQRKSWFRRR